MSQQVAFWIVRINRRPVLTVAAAIEAIRLVPDRSVVPIEMVRCAEGTKIADGLRTDYLQQPTRVLVQTAPKFVWRQLFVDHAAGQLLDEGGNAVHLQGMKAHPSSDSGAGASAGGASSGAGSDSPGSPGEPPSAIPLIRSSSLSLWEGGESAIEVHEADEAESNGEDESEAHSGSTSHSTEQVTGSSASSSQGEDSSSAASGSASGGAASESRKVVVAQAERPEPAAASGEAQGSVHPLQPRPQSLLACRSVGSDGVAVRWGLMGSDWLWRWMVHRDLQVRRDVTGIDGGGLLALGEEGVKARKKQRVDAIDGRMRRARGGQRRGWSAAGIFGAVCGGVVVAVGGVLVVAGVAGEVQGVGFTGGVKRLVSAQLEAAGASKWAEAVRKMNSASG